MIKRYGKAKGLMVLILWILTLTARQMSFFYTHENDGRLTLKGQTRSSRRSLDPAAHAPEALVQLLRKEAENTTRSIIVEDNDDDDDDFEANYDGDLRTTPSTGTSNSASTKSISEDEATYWMKHGCFYYENVCHSSYHWFFRNDDNKQNKTNNKWQEPFSVNLHYRGFPNRPVLLSNYPRQINVTLSSQSSQQRCYTSPISHHLVYSSLYNNMIGEFWLRAMTGMYRLFQLDKQPRNDITNSTSTAFSPLNISPQDLQTYLLVYQNGGIMNGHRLFSSSTIPSTHAVLPFTSLLDQTNCQCLSKLIMCGFRDETTESTNQQDKNTEQMKKNPPPAQRAASTEQNATTATAATATTTNPTRHDANTNTTTAFTPRQQLVPYAENIYWSAASRRHGNDWKHKEYHKSLVQLQSHLQQHLFGRGDDNYSTLRFLPQMVTERRRNWLRQHAEVNISDSSNDDWKIVGLAQRGGRRVWTNLAQILRHCNHRYNKHNILCIEVNVDKVEMSHPIQQAIVHRAIDTLMGIHGSHLTNAIMMSPGSYLVELLPWIPEFQIYGRGFFRTTSGPTPIGWMFTNTPINHVGIALERSSCPGICPETFQQQQGNNQLHKISDDDMACLWSLHSSSKSRGQLAWATREFVVDPVILDEFLKRFLLPINHEAKQEHKSTCREVRNRAERQPRLLLSGKEQDFVLFNVQCHDDQGTISSPHQFYTNYTNGEIEAARDLMDQLKSAASN